MNFHCANIAQILHKQVFCVQIFNVYSEKNSPYKVLKPLYGLHYLLFLNQANLCIIKPERSFGSNQVALGGIILPVSAIVISCFIETGYSANAIFISPESTLFFNSPSPLIPPTKSILLSERKSFIQDEMQLEPVPNHIDCLAKLHIRNDQDFYDLVNYY